MAKAKKAPAKDALDLLAEGDPKGVIALMLWQDRFRNPDLSRLIRMEDLETYDRSMEYLNAKGLHVSIVRPQGREARPALQADLAAGRPRAMPAIPAEPARPFVFVGLVDKDGNNVKPIESREEDADRRDEANKIRRAAESAPRIAGLLLGMCQSGTFSNSEITDAANALNTLAAAVNGRGA